MATPPARLRDRRLAGCGAVSRPLPGHLRRVFFGRPTARYIFAGGPKIVSRRRPAGSFRPPLHVRPGRGGAVGRCATRLNSSGASTVAMGWSPGQLRSPPGSSATCPASERGRVCRRPAGKPGRLTVPGFLAAIHQAVALFRALRAHHPAVAHRATAGPRRLPPDFYSPCCSHYRSAPRSPAVCRRRMIVTRAGSCGCPHSSRWSRLLSLSPARRMRRDAFWSGLERCRRCRPVGHFIICRRPDRRPGGNSG